MSEIDSKVSDAASTAREEMLRANARKEADAAVNGERRRRQVCYFSLGSHYLMLLYTI